MCSQDLEKTHGQHTHILEGVVWEWHWDGPTLHLATAGGPITHTWDSPPSHRHSHCASCKTLLWNRTQGPSHHLTQLMGKGKETSFCRESLMKSPKSDALPKAARPLHPGSPRSHKAELQSWGSAANPERGCHQSHRPTLEGAVTIQGCPLRAVVGPAWAPALQNWTLSRGREHPVVAVPCHQVPLPKHLHHTCCSSVNILQESPGQRKELGALPGIPHGARARSRACPRPQAAHTPPLAPGVC